MFKGMIGFEDYAIECIIGVFAEERKQPQKIFVDLKVEVDIEKGAQTDHFKDVYDYVQLAEMCTEMAQKKEYALLETFAYEVITKLEEDPQVFWAAIKIKKPSALESARYTFVELESQKKRGSS